jgi:hypothetical protein
MRTHKALIASALFVTASGSGCSKRDSPGQVTLSGPRVVRHATPPYFRERERYVLKGEGVGRGCLYRSKAKPGFGAEWVVEQDRDSCTQVRARGDVIGPISMKAAHTAGHTVSNVGVGPRNP